MAKENASHAPGSDSGFDGTRQRYGMAEGNGPMKGGDFGVGALPGSGAIPGDKKAMYKDLGPGDRAGGETVGLGKGKMGSQPHPDHGPHKHYEP